MNFEPQRMTRQARRFTEDSLHDMEDVVRHHPGGAMIATLFTGFAIGVVTMALWPPSRAQTHSNHLLGNLESQLRRLTDSPLRSAAAAASDTINDLRRGMRNQETNVGKTFRSMSSRVRSLFF